jgi:hypothetical protein
VDFPCEYPICREIATIIIEIERDYVPMTRRVCEVHAKQAQAIAKQHDAIAYRIYRA